MPKAHFILREKFRSESEEQKKQLFQQKFEQYLKNALPQAEKP